MLETSEKNGKSQLRGKLPQPDKKPTAISIRNDEKLNAFL